MKDFNYSSLDDGTIKITKYVVSANIDIPSVINGKNVTTIDDGAFERCDTLESITIHNSVTTIGNNAFGYCWNINNRRRKVKKFHICCYKDTAGEKYAVDNRFNYT